MKELTKFILEIVGIICLGSAYTISLKDIFGAKVVIVLGILCLGLSRLTKKEVK